jgi:uncharacterized protein YndB with AHSA1/START domain
VAEREVRINHVFDAPREEVFEAWTDPDRVAIWWAPEGFEIPRDSVIVEPRVGGRFHLTMAGVAGQGTFHLRAEILEISPPELIVMRSEPIPEGGIMEATITRVVFEVEGSGTRMILVDGPYSDDMRGNAAAGWNSVVLNLEGLLKQA